MDQDYIQIIPLGGVREIGKNMWLIRYDDSFLVIDTGLKFPSADMHGVDIIIPDMSYLLAHKEMIAGIVLTHAHEDHVGALPHLLSDLDEPPPIYASELTLGLLEDRLKKFRNRGLALNPVAGRDRVQIGPFDVEFIHVCHSISGALGMGIHTPVGTIVFTGDFKFDQTPIDGQPADYFKFAELGEKGVLALLSDSTNATRPGITPSEKDVAHNFVNIFHQAKGRIIVATFASSLHRIQQLVNRAVEFGRKIAFVGRSMEKVTSTAKKLGYFSYPDEMLVNASEINQYPPEELLIVTTGSQGEPMAMLSRMARGESRHLCIIPGDTVIISAHPIPGNEKSVFNNVNQLYVRGAQVIYESWRGVHVSGHASQEELKLMLNLVRPRFFIPMHGEQRHMVNHGELAVSVGVPRENVLLLENGDIAEITTDTAEIVGQTAAGGLLVDGSGVGYLEEKELSERQALVRDGVIFASLSLDWEGQVLASPQIVSKGFIFEGDYEALYQEASAIVVESLESARHEGLFSLEQSERIVRETLLQFSHKKTGRRPIVIPIVHQVGEDG